MDLLWMDGERLDYVDNTILLHERDRCVGVVRDGTLYTHNFTMRPRKRGTWRPVPRDAVPARLVAMLAVAERRAAARDGA